MKEIDGGKKVSRYQVSVWEKSRGEENGLEVSAKVQALHFENLLMDTKKLQEVVWIEFYAANPLRQCHWILKTRPLIASQPLRLRRDL